MAASSRSRDDGPLSAIIIGGGISGLSAAWYLERAAREDDFAVSTVVVEREDLPGGKIRTLDEDGYILESGPDGFLTRKPWAMTLANELGLEGDVVYPRTADASLLLDGELHPIPRGLMGPAPASRRAVWDASFLSWRGKLRANLEPFVRRRTSTGPESLGDFLRRRMGAEITDTLLEPLTAGIYGGNSYDMSLTALFPMLLHWEQRYGSITRGMQKSRKDAKGRQQPPGAFFSFAAGAHTIVRAIVDSLGKTDVIRGHSATEVDHMGDPDEPGYRVTLDDMRSFEADVVVLATPARDAGSLVRPFAPGLARLLNGRRGSAAGSAYVAFHKDDVSHPLDGSGFLAPRSEGGPVTGCTWMSSKWPGRSPKGHVLLRAFLGEGADGSFMERTDDELVDAAVETLRPLLGIQGPPARAWVHRWADAMPYYGVDHAEWLEGVDREAASYPGLFLCGASYRGIGVPDCIRQGRDTAERIRSLAIQYHGRRSPQTLSA